MMMLHLLGMEWSTRHTCTRGGLWETHLVDYESQRARRCVFAVVDGGHTLRDAVLLYLVLMLWVIVKAFR